MRARAAAIAGLVLVMSACTGSSHTATDSASSSTEPSTQSTVAQPAASTFTPKPIEWKSCAGGLECGTLDVPLDYADPTGPTITLGLNRRVARIRATKIGSLLVNPGGPGGSGIEYVQGGLDVSDDVKDRFDIIGFDPRGVGESTKIDCASDSNKAFHHLDPSPDTPTEQTALDSAAESMADECETKAGAMLPHVGTDDVVRDMDTIRAAVGDDKLSYIGYSYGSLLGLRYAQLFPQRVRAIVVDGVVDPTQGFVDFLRGQTIAFDKQVSALLGSALADYDTLAARVEADPITLDNGDTIGPNELATAALTATYSPNSGSLLRRAIQSGLDGDATLLNQLDNAYEASVQFSGYAAVECIDSPHPVGADEYKQFADSLTAISPRFGPSIANELLTCAFWQAPVKSVVGKVDATGAAPLLVIGTTGDAATPYEQAVRVASDLARAALLTVKGTGHTSAGNACAEAATSRYLVDLQLPDAGATC